MLDLIERFRLIQVSRLPGEPQAVIQLVILLNLVYEITIGIFGDSPGVRTFPGFFARQY